MAVFAADGAGGLQCRAAATAVPGHMLRPVGGQGLGVADEQGAHQARHVDHHQRAVAVAAALAACRDGAAAVQAAGLALFAGQGFEVVGRQRPHQSALGQQQAEGLQVAVFAGALQRREAAEAGEVVHGFHRSGAARAVQARGQHTGRPGRRHLHPPQQADPSQAGQPHRLEFIEPHQVAVGAQVAVDGLAVMPFQGQLLHAALALGAGAGARGCKPGMGCKRGQGGVHARLQMAFCTSQPLNSSGSSGPAASAAPPLTSTLTASSSAPTKSSALAGICRVL